MTNLKVSDIVTKDAVATFMYYRDSQLWYNIGEFSFPVPIDDIGNATFNGTEKALLMMRYVRKHLKTIKEQHK